MRGLIGIITIVVVGTAAAAPQIETRGLAPAEIEEGWIYLFDEATTFGWLIHGPAAVQHGSLILGGGEQTTAVTTTVFGPSDFLMDYSYDGKAGQDHAWVSFGATQRRISGTAKGQLTGKLSGPPAAAPASPVRIVVPADTKLEVRTLGIRPYGLESIFNGKDLTGWKVFPGARYKSQFTIAPFPGDNRINVKNGPGDLQTVKTFADFVFQGECISNGDHLNSGIFFRCLPNQYQQGYEMQIRNEWKDNDRTKPVDYGTGAIYRRQPARKVVSTDREWFTMTLVAHGNHFATWVNGYQVTDWTDTRPEKENPREGLRLGPGHLSIQGHDPTTDLSFRNLRVAELKK
jgi:hypothetical protein